MRIYIISNDGIALCREAPATVNEGEIAIASKEELHAAPLSGRTHEIAGDCARGHKPTPGPGDDHIDLSAATPGADRPLAPIENWRVRAVSAKRPRQDRAQPAPATSAPDDQQPPAFPHCRA
jgi:hypothetical protein